MRERIEEALKTNQELRSAVIMEALINLACDGSELGSLARDALNASISSHDYCPPEPKISLCPLFDETEPRYVHGIKYKPEIIVGAIWILRKMISER